MLVRRWVNLVLFFGVWTLLGALSAARLMLSYAYSGNTVSWRSVFVIAFADWYVWAALVPAIIWLARRYAVERRSWLRILLVHLPASLFFSILKMTIEIQVLVWFNTAPRRVNVLLQLPSTLFTYWAILGVIYAIDYYRKYREHELKATRLENQLAQAQLQALKMQLHPHFLFNTLHAISSLMRKDVEAADSMITNLSDLLRLTLENTGVQEVTLRQELEFLERYLEIEQTRFRDRLQVRMDIEPETLDARLPNLILQPLVENAIRHGIAPRSAPGWIEIRAARHEEMLQLQIGDNGPGLPVGRQAEFKEGIGLTNTRARLSQLYGAEHSFELNNADQGGVKVKLTIPFRTESETNNKQQ